MKTKLSFRELLAVGSMLFGLFFGAGNLIFPASMGQLAGSRVLTASAGLLVTGVGLPLLGVAALGISRCDGLAALTRRVGKNYSLFFTCLLYLTIGPFFAIPRCATVPFEVGVAPALGGGGGQGALALFSLVFFGADLGGQGAQPAVSGLPGGAGGDGPGQAHGPAGRRRPRGRVCPVGLCGRLPRGIQHHGRFGGPGVRHRGGAGHPGPRRHRAGRGGRQHGGGRLPGLRADGGHLPGGGRGGRGEPRALPGGLQRRRGPADHCPALLRGFRRGDPGRDRHLCLRQDGGGPHHQLFPDVLRAVPPRAVLPGVGGRVLPVLVRGGQLRPGDHPGMGHPGADVPVSFGHHPDPSVFGCRWAGCWTPPGAGCPSIRWGWAGSVPPWPAWPWGLSGGRQKARRGRDP